MSVQVPRVRDRGANADGMKVHFNASLIPPYLRKAKSVAELLPWLYLKHCPAGDACIAERGHLDGGLQGGSGFVGGPACRGVVVFDNHTS
ncbi:hypothetical protein OAN307_c40510 [Octadecabacter antarcticus 307]|uniref:Uncharacterized protein n=1 Tax=Octadecabacter antarcticus 307 TaxID=391626 RepID=M9RCK1_9RHOB|nr:hypothetical protein OAN307_c40510 [Octadecabacter antarcticus 307]